MTTRSEAAGLADYAGLLSDTTRAMFCLALLDGRAWTAGELARHAGVSPATATGHLHKLIAGGVATERRQGRHRYIQLAGPRVARLIEDLAAQLTPAPPAAGLRAATVSAALARGRTCYDHLAGRIGVAITEAMIAADLIDTTGGFALSDKGFAWMSTELGVDTSQWNKQRRPVARECLDWTERRSHLAGLAGAQLCRSFFDRGWLRRIGSQRAVRLTEPGIAAIHRRLGIDAARLELD